MLTSIQALDGGILLWLQSVRHPLLDGLLTFYTQLGNAGIGWIVLSIVLLFFKRTRKSGVLSLCAMLFGLIGTNLILKNLVQRIRPYGVVEGLEHLVHITDPNSFPSGHTTAAFAAGVVWLRTLPARWARILALASAFLMAFSRLYVGVHYPTDVLAGAVIGTVCALLALWLGKRWKLLRRLGE